MKKMTFLFLSIFIWETNTFAGDTIKQTIETDYFGFECPADWTIMEKTISSVIAISPDVEKNKICVASGIEKTEVKDFDVFLKNFLEELQENTFPPAKIITNERLQIEDDYECQHLLVTTASGHSTITIEWFFLYKHNKVYMIMFNADSSVFPKYQYIGKDILNSFKIK